MAGHANDNSSGTKIYITIIIIIFSSRLEAHAQTAHVAIHYHHS